jgi:5-hydroxyisourate hydrolase-like protein (transthyretin family)
MKSPIGPLAILFLLASSTATQAQGTEVEPNHPCELAQTVGEPALPFALRGALDALLEEGDVDFYRFRGTPNAAIQVDLEGQATGAGTLGEPFLGLFDSTCSFVKRGSNRESRNARLLATIPADGEFILAASACCDHDFGGQVGVGGSYLLSIQRAALLRSISGRLVDAVSGVPIAGSQFPFARAELYRCTLEDCSEWVNGDSATPDGQFFFQTDSWGDLLFAGTYRIRATASQYGDAEGTPFDVGDAEERDLGDIGLVPLARIGSITGRVVDLVSGIPLPGDGEPYARVELRRCEDGTCNTVQFEATDAQGRYRFDDAFFEVLAPGTYQVHASAEEYREGETTSFAVGEGEDAVLSDLPLEPFPVGFSEIRPCGNMPTQGGICIFSVRIHNRSAAPVNGAAWSIVEAFGTGSLLDRTVFQAGTRWVSIAPGHSQVAWFLFLMPASLRDGSLVCSDIYFGQGPPGTAFNTVTKRSLFCISKGANGAFRVLDEKELGKLLMQRSRNEVEAEELGRSVRPRRP